jgi:septum formation protein
MRLILASTSPRRRDILSLLGVPFEIIAPSFDESVSRRRSIEEEVLEFAVEKAASVAAKNPQSVVIGSDTMISLAGEKFGKPASVEEARRMLRAFSGKRHDIYTAVAIMDGCGGAGLRIVETVAVKMRAFSDDQMENYLRCGESMDKAGAYSIQGQADRLIESIEGDYLAAVGMPLKPIVRYLQERGISVPLNVEEFYREKTFPNWRRFQS